jgi:hypothetical protein
LAVDGLKPGHRVIDGPKQSEDVGTRQPCSRVVISHVPLFLRNDESRGYDLQIARDNESRSLG